MLMFELAADNQLAAVGRAEHATAAGSQLATARLRRVALHQDSVTSLRLPQRLLTAAGG